MYSLQKDFILKDGKIFRFFNKDAQYTPTSPCWYPYEQFLTLVTTTVPSNDVIKWYLVPQNVYIFYGKMSSEFLAKEGEYKWSDILNNKEIKRMKNDSGKIVLSYLIVDFTSGSGGEKSKQTPFVSSFKNFTRYNGILELMLAKIEEKYNLRL